MKRYSYKNPKHWDDETQVLHLGDFERGELALLATHRISNSELFQGFTAPSDEIENFGSKVEPTDWENL